MSAKNESGTDTKKKFETKYNPTLLRECINEGLHASQIMEKLGITHKQTMKHFVSKLIHQDRKFYDVRGLYVSGSGNPYVGKNGIVRINLSRPDFQEAGFKEGDEFSVYIEDGKIILSKHE